MTTLFDPIQMGKLSLPNRIIMAPLTRCRASAGRVPNALMARGVFGRRAGRSVGGLLVWEILKLCLSGALMVLAPVVLRPIDWAALLVTMVLCLKSIAVALFIQQRRTRN